MADTWTCPNCKSELRCSCQSMECSFDYDIKAHVRADLIRALETALGWMDAQAVTNITERTLSENKEPCCDACTKSNG